MRNWQWWKLYTRVKPLLTQAKAEDEMRKMAEDYESTKKELDKMSAKMKELEEQNVVLLQQKNDMFAQMQAGDSTVSDLEEKVALLINQKGDQDEEIKELEDRLKDLEGGSEELMSKLDKKNDENSELKKNVENLELNLQKVGRNRCCLCLFVSCLFNCNSFFNHNFPSTLPFVMHVVVTISLCGRPA